ncbi:MAG: sigma-54-dependent Fis family transcriptional regulator, partial [Aliifodinibius sp.]|nr:sigma-54-dependent Fis family transcriptional regulator [Fodinibius sp.]
KAVKLGAYNFFDKDEVSIDQIVQSINNALEHRQLKLENRQLRHAAGQDSSIIGKSKAIQELRKQIRKMAEVPSNILIVGESGTGKELVAREIHRLSLRANKPFVALNCAALPENLVE